MTENGFGLYIHWPYCARKCPYCDFNSHVRRDPTEAGWLSGVLRDMEYVARLQGASPAERPQLSTIYFGGGTPSLMTPSSAAGIIELAGDLWRITSDIEITMEANPASSEAARFADVRAAGVNRLSLGVQSLRDESLKFLGRLHDVAEAKKALAAAQKIFPRVTFDLIYALPHQKLADWQAELREALAFGASHMSLYQLTIEPQTQFATLYAAGKIRMPDEDISAEFYDATCEMMAAAGLPPYEVSNYAAPGQESRHNLIYWRYGQYAGLGPGAHGRLDLADGRYATAAIKKPRLWRDAITNEGHGFEVMEMVDPREAAEEHLLMNLRLREGLDLAAYEGRWNVTISREKIAELQGMGLICLTDGRLAATPDGALVLNMLIRELAESL